MKMLSPVCGVGHDLARLEEVVGVLARAHGPVDPLAQVGVDRQHLRLADAAVHVAREHQLVVPQDVAQRDRRPAEEAAAEVVARVSDRRPRDVVGREVHPVVLQRELAGVGQAVVGRIHQRLDRHRLRELDRVAGPGQVARRAEALLRAVDRAALADLRPHLLPDLERAGGVERRRGHAGQDARRCRRPAAGTATA